VVPRNRFILTFGACEQSCRLTGLIA
jgi:hypothetical protein